MESLTLHSPAKINLMLSVHGRREDGFHALTSLVVPLAFGDTLEVSVKNGCEDGLRSSQSGVPLTMDNLILRAAAAFREVTSEQVFFDFHLIKRIPMGAGLGGGSSNAAAALKAMNELAGGPLDDEAAVELLSRLGSDCPLFYDAVPTVMRGRGEILEPLEPVYAERIRGQRLVLFRPHFPIHTGWAYQQLIEGAPSSYTSEADAENRLRAFREGAGLGSVLANTFESCVGRKYLAIPCLLEKLRDHGYDCLMSGSGSCCFALVADSNESEAIQQICFDAWGEGIFFIETSSD